VVPAHRWEPAEAQWKTAQPVAEAEFFGSGIEDDAEVDRPVVSERRGLE
jgi:hypothetical protein